MSVPDEKGNPPLWLALASNLEDIASTLVSHAKQPLLTDEGGQAVSQTDWLPMTITEAKDQPGNKSNEVKDKQQKIML